MGTVDVKTQEKTFFGTVNVEAKKTFQPDESKEHYNSIHKREKSEAKKPVETKKQSHHEKKSKKHNIQVRTTMHSSLSPALRNSRNSHVNSPSTKRDMTGNT